MTAAATTMTEPKAVLLVAAAVLFDKTKKQLLITTRPQGKAMAGQWEFAGGKMEAGETPEQTVTREYAEELGIALHQDALSPLTFASHSYEKFHLLMTVFLCTAWTGTAKPAEGQDMAWVSPQDLPLYDFVPADIPLIPLIQKLID